MSPAALKYEQWKSMWLWCEMGGSFDTSPAAELADGYWMSGALTAVRDTLAASYGAAA